MRKEVIKELEDILAIEYESFKNIGRQLNKFEKFVLRLEQFLAGSYLKLYLGKDIVLDLDECELKLKETEIKL